MNDSTGLPATPAEALAQAVALDGPLGRQLAAYVASSRRLRPDISAAYDNLVERLRALRLGRLGPAVGEAMPNFLLPDADGRLVDLEALRRRGPVVISFNRGHWCPYCRLELHALAAIHGAAKGLDAEIVSIVPERAEYARKMIAANALPFPLLTDIDLAYALPLGLVYWVGAEIRDLYDRLGLDLATYQGSDAPFLPIAATFIVDAAGIVRARHIDPDFRKRMATEEILAVLGRLARAE